MRKRRLLILLALTFNFMACNQTDEDKLGGEDVTHQFLSEYSGSYEEKGAELGGNGERIIISRNGDIEVVKHRQVGSENNPAIPKPTYCSFTMTGHIAVVIQLSEERTRRTSKAGNEYHLPQTHNLIFIVDNVMINNELREGSTEDTGCMNFAEQMNAKVPVYTYGLELFGSGMLRLHTSGTGQYQGGERTESTLDEVFVRQEL